MAIGEGTHPQGAAGQSVRYRVEYEVVGNAVHYRASFACSDGRASTHEGQFDFDRAKVGAAAAVDAFMQNHIAKSGFDVAP